MPGSERRRTRRFKLKVPLRVHRSNAGERPQRVSSLNISASGVCFATNHPLSVGQSVELNLCMPKRIPGTPSGECFFTGRVVHVEAHNGTRNGASEVGVQFLYYETRGAHPNVYDR
jgi:c-di-GMP-binding flagellar brake protein YcgR